MRSVIPQRNALDGIFNIVQVDIEDSIVLKDKLPKLCKKLGKFSDFIFHNFPVYRMVCNAFENSIFMNRSWRSTSADLRDILSKYVLQDSQILSEYLHGDENYKFYKDIVRFISSKSILKLVRIVKKNNKDQLNDSYVLTQGRDEILSAYLSIAAILYGMINIHNNKFILYYQPYYDDINLNEFLSKKFDLLYNNKDFIISFRFYNKTPNLFKILSQYSNNINNNNIYVSSVEDFNYDLKEFSNITLDNDADRIQE